MYGALCPYPCREEGREGRHPPPGPSRYAPQRPPPVVTEPYPLFTFVLIFMVFSCFGLRPCPSHVDLANPVLAD